MIWLGLSLSLFVYASFEPSELLNNLADKFDIVFDTEPISTVDAEYWTRHERLAEEQNVVEPFSKQSQSPFQGRFQTHQVHMSVNESYLCFIPPIKDREEAFEQQWQKQQASLNDAGHSLTQRGLRLVQPIFERTLYYRSNGWFVYSLRLGPGGVMRQFRELQLPPPSTPQEIEQRQKMSMIPQEDPKFEAYTLGKHPSLRQHNAASKSKERGLAPLSTEDRQKGLEATTNVRELTLGSNTGLGKQYYLTQMWADGAICEITGRPRQVEVQYNCLEGHKGGMDRDVITSVRETSTCLYLVVVSTSRLCADEAFRKYEVPEVVNTIHCQPIVDRSLPDGSEETKSLEDESKATISSQTSSPASQVQPTAVSTEVETTPIAEPEQATKVNSRLEDATITPAPNTDRPLTMRIEELLKKMAEALEEVDYDAVADSEDDTFILGSPELEDAIADILAQNEAQGEANRAHDEL